MLIFKALIPQGKIRAWLLDLKNWSRLPHIYGHDEEAMYRNKRNILFSQITLVGGIAGIFHGVESLLDHNYLLPFLDFLMTAFVFVSYQLNESGRHLTAKVLLLTFLNIFFFFYSLITPREIGIYVFYFPWVAAAALVFNTEERFWRILFIGLSVTLLLVLFISDFSLLSEWRLSFAQSGRPFVVNVVTSLLITAIFIYFMIQLNEVSEERLRKLTDEIRQKNAELQRSNEQLDRFVYSASHGIKLPIISIKGLTHLASIDCDDQKSLTYFTKIESQTDKLGRSLLEMLEYTRNSKTSIKLERVNIHSVVDEVIDNLSHLENASRVEIRKFVRIDEFVMLDRVRIMVILNNLVSNAIKYHNYSLPNPWVKVMISKVGDKIQVMVADNGFGIHDQYKEKIFEMFFRASDSAIGSGLGLFIVKETVEKMNGKIMLSSTEGEGACFRIDLPLVA
ncbi:MAG: HAMP domain-containing sensor histidine kinase [Bacteroidota bacterium]